MTPGERTQLANDLANRLNDAYGYLPLSVRYEAADQAIAIADRWKEPGPPAATGGTEPGSTSRRLPTAKDTVARGHPAE